MASPLIRRIASMFPERDPQARVAGRHQYLERAAPSAVAQIRVAANCCGGRRNGAFFVHLPVGDSKGVACSRSNSSAKRMDDGLPRFRLFRAFSRMATPRQRREPTSLLWRCASSRIELTTASRFRRKRENCLPPESLEGGKSGHGAAGAQSPWMDAQASVRLAPRFGARGLARLRFFVSRRRGDWPTHAHAHREAHRTSARRPLLSLTAKHVFGVSKRGFAVPKPRPHHTPSSGSPSRLSIAAEVLRPPSRRR